jgi:hypothetical protein
MLEKQIEHKLLTETRKKIRALFKVRLSRMERCAG